jgi:hypothetical protein
VVIASLVPGLAKQEIQVVLLDIMENEKLYWHQRSNEHWLLQGVHNTAFVHRVANGKKILCIL